MSTNKAPSTTTVGLLKRPDDAAIENISGRVIEFETALLKVFEKNPGYHTYLKEPVAKFEEGLTYNKALRKKSLDEAPDISIHPDALVRKFPAILFIDQPNGVCGIIDLLLAFYQRSPATLDLFLDTKDNAVAGGLSILQLFVYSANVIYLLDMRALGQSAFTTTSSFG